MSGGCKPPILGKGRPYGQARSQDFYKGGHDDGGTEGPERGTEAQSAGAPRGGWGLGKSAIAPPQHGGLGA